MDKVTYSRAPVDRGWAWMCAVGSMLISFTAVGAARTFGLFYVDIMEEFNASAGTVSLIFGAQMTVTVFSPLAGVLHSRYGARPVVAAGASLSTFGLVVSSLVPNIYYVIFFGGLINGVGLCLMYSPGIGVLSQYFCRHRALAIGFAFTGSSIAQLIIPVIVSYWLQTFTVRGTILLYSGIFAHGLIAAALFRPLSFYERSNAISKSGKTSYNGGNVVVGNFEMKNVVDSPSFGETGCPRDIEIQTGNHCRSSNASSCENIIQARSDVTLIYEETRCRANTLDNCTLPQSTHKNRRKDRRSDDHSSNTDESCLENTQNTTTPEVLVVDTSDDARTLTKCFFAVFPRRLACNYAFVAFLTCCGPGNFFLIDAVILMPAMAQEAGIDKNVIVWLMFLIGAVELISRVIAGWLIDMCRQVVPPYYIAGSCCAMLAVGLLRCGLAPDYPSIVVLCLIEGCCGGCLVVSVPVVIIELVGAEHFARGFSIVTATGFINAIVILLLGMLRDKTGDYGASYLLLGALFVMPTLVYLVLLPIIQRCRRRKTNSIISTAPKL